MSDSMSSGNETTLSKTAETDCHDEMGVTIDGQYVEALSFSKGATVVIYKDHTSLCGDHRWYKGRYECCVHYFQVTILA